MWTPRVTVAAIVKYDGKFLLVREKPENSIVYNQPAGHLEENEALIDAIKREVYEETGVDFSPTALVGIYRWQPPEKRFAYVRFAFTGEISSTMVKPVDKDIIDAVWLSPAEISAVSSQHRSPQVMAGIRDFENGMRYNLDILREGF